MKIMLVLPNVDGVDNIIKEFESTFNTSDILHRTNFNQALNFANEYDLIVVHQNVSDIPLTVCDFEEIHDVMEGQTLIPLLNVDHGDPILEGIYSLGIYNALIKSDGTVHNIFNLHKKERTRKQAKDYYKVEGVYKKEETSLVLTDEQLNRIILNLKNATDIESEFESHMQFLSNAQRLFLVNMLPDELKEHLSDCDAYLRYSRMKGDGSASPEIIETTQFEQQTVERTLMYESFMKRRSLITVFGNSEFSSELGYIASKHLKQDVLIIDIETLTPDIHYVLGMKETVNPKYSIADIATKSSFVQAYELASSNNLTYELLRNIAVRVKNSSLYVLTGNDLNNKVESLNHVFLDKVVNIALDTFGIVIVNSPFDIYDSLPLSMLVKNNNTLIFPFDSNSQSFARTMKRVKFISSIHNINMKNVKYVATDFIKTASMDESDIRSISSGHYLGKVSQDLNRHRARNDLFNSYVFSITNHVEAEYTNILVKLGFDLKVSTFKKIKSIIFKRKK